MPVGVRWRAHGISRATIEREAREYRRISVRLRQHPHMRQPVYIAVLVAEAAVVLGIVVLEEDHGLVGGHQAPRRLGEAVALRAFRIELPDRLATNPPELVSHARERELGDIRRAA